MPSKQNKYNPTQKYNPALLSKRLDKMGNDIERFRQVLISTNKANDQHIEHLSNFVRHDMKNAIQGLDGIIYNASNDKTIDEDTLEQLKTALSLLRSSLDNFSKIIPSSREQATTLPEIMIAVEMLSRYDIQQAKIDFELDYDRNSNAPICRPFQSLVQILNNFIINAVNAFKGSEKKRLLIKAVIDCDRCRIDVLDNAPTIPSADRERVFEYGYSTTGGTGIGLFHAKSVLDEMGGSITLSDSPIDGYTKCFTIEFQTKSDNE